MKTTKKLKITGISIMTLGFAILALSFVVGAFTNLNTVEVYLGIGMTLVMVPMCIFAMCGLIIMMLDE